MPTSSANPRPRLVFPRRPRLERNTAFTLARPRGRQGAFTLVEMLVVIVIISILLVAVIPAVNSLSKSSGGKAAVSNFMNVVEQARTLAITSGNATYVVFADETLPPRSRPTLINIAQRPTSFFKTRTLSRLPSANGTSSRRVFRFWPVPIRRPMA